LTSARASPSLTLRERLGRSLIALLATPAAKVSSPPTEVKRTHLALSDEVRKELARN